MGSKSQQSTSQQSTTPAALGQLQSIYNTVSNAASTPYQAYSGELTAGTNAQQAAGTNTINTAYGQGQPYYNQASGLLQSGSSPLTSSDIQTYESPYVQSVVNATQAQLNLSNAQQQNQVKGNAAISGALGGDRQAVAQSQLAAQQQTAEAPVIANLYNTGYNNAVSTAQQQKQNQLNAANSYGSLGNSAISGALNTGNAQIGAGTLQQQTQQAADTAAYQQYQNQQAYPYQSAAFLQQYGLPTALAMGSTTNGSQTSPGPNYYSQILGLGTAALSAFSDRRVKENVHEVGKTFDNQPIYRFNYRGSPLTQIGLMAQDVEHKHPEAVGEAGGVKTVNYDEATRDAADKGRFAFGGYVDGSMPYSSGTSYVPTAKASNAQLQTPTLQYAKTGQSSSSTADLGKSIGTAVKAFGNSNNNTTPDYGQTSNIQIGNYSMPSFGNTVPVGDYSMPTIGFNAGGFVDAVHQIREGIRRSRGGAVTSPFGAYASGGDIDLADRFAPVETAIANGDFDPQGINSTAFAPSPLTQAAKVPLPVARPAGAPSSDDAAPAPTQVALPRAITAPEATTDSEQPTSAMAYSGVPQSPMTAPAPSDAAPAASAPTQAESRFGSFNPLNLSDKTREALIATGLGMAASRSPFIGTAIAEGGLGGLNAYSNASKEEAQEADKAATRAQEQQRIDLQAKQIVANIENQRRQTASADLIPDGKGGMMPNPAKLDFLKKQSEINQKDNWAPIGTVVGADGSSHPLVMNRADHSVIDVVTQKPPSATDRVQGIPGKGPDQAVIQHNVDAIVSGHQPPTLTGLYGQSAAVRAGLEEKGFDLAKAQLEWKQAEKQIASLNGPQMTRFVGLAHSVDSTIDEVRDLSKQMNMSGIPALNSVELAAYIKANGNSDNGQLATRYMAAINTLREEFANLANGGYAPTEPAWRLAGEQINGNYGVKQLGSSLDEVQRLIRYRVQAIPGLTQSGPGSANRYTGQSGAAPSAPANAEAAPDRSGWQWNPARRQYRDSNGNLYDENGKPVKP